MSPTLFVLVLDFALRAYTCACEELGITHEANWWGFADDLAIQSGTEKNAEKAFHQLQAACAFVGLHVNGKKCEGNGDRS